MTGLIVGYVEDVERLKKTFRGLGFDVRLHVNCSHKTTLEKLGDLQHDARTENVSQLVVVVLSHGKQVRAYY